MTVSLFHMYGRELRAASALWSWILEMHVRVGLGKPTTTELRNPHKVSSQQSQYCGGSREKFMSISTASLRRRRRLEKEFSDAVRERCMWLSTQRRCLATVTVTFDQKRNPT